MVIFRERFSQFNSVQLPYILELFDAGIRQKGVHSSLPKMRQSGGTGGLCVGVARIEDIRQARQLCGMEWELPVSNQGKTSAKRDKEQ